ncbi:MAG: ABC transporter substrate-binding protein [Alphaproteobacteria bacterium]
MTKKLNWKSIIGWGVAIVFVGCILYFNSSKTEGKLRFVVMAPLSGPVGYLGQEEKLGIEEAYKNAPNKDDVELIFEDTQGNATMAISILQGHLAMGDKFFYTSTTAQTNAVLSVLETQQDKPFVFTITMMPNQTKGYPLAYRIYPTSMQEMEGVAEYVKQKGYKKLGVLTAMMATYEGCIKHLQALLPDVTIYEESFNTDEKDFRILLEKMKRENVEAILVNGYAPHFRSIIHHKDTAWDIPLLLGFNTLQLNDLPYSQLKDVVFRQPEFIMEIPKSDKFQNNDKISVGYETFYAYDTMDMFMKAVAQAKERTPETVGKAMENLNFNGLTGKIIFDKDRDAILKQKMFKFNQDKKVVPVESEEK